MPFLRTNGTSPLLLFFSATVAGKHQFPLACYFFNRQNDANRFFITGIRRLIEVCKRNEALRKGNEKIYFIMM